jgi:hypothetical protein
MHASTDRTQLLNDKPPSRRRLERYLELVTAGNRPAVPSEATRHCTTFERPVGACTAPTWVSLEAGVRASTAGSRSHYVERDRIDATEEPLAMRAGRASGKRSDDAAGGSRSRAGLYA